MISISGKKWSERKIDKNLVEKLTQTENFSQILSKLVIAREFDDEEIYSINNEIELNNVFKFNNDYQQSLNLVFDSVLKKEKICILGDYDVDGSVSTSLLVSFFKDIDHPYFFYIPDREKDGYGASVNLIKELIKKNPKIVIMVDCGSNSFESISYLKKNKIKSVIIDHHQINKPFPLANSIINPKKDNGYIEYDYLCSASLTYFFLDLLIKKLVNKKVLINFNIKNYLIYVLLATVCDVMPLRKLNRVIAINALKKTNINNNKILNKIYQIANKNNKITINDLGYFIGPILNSGGRLGKSKYATQLLSSNNEKDINIIANKLVKLNEKRKIIEDKILEDINFHQIEKSNKSIIVIYNPNFNEGLIGIIAARIKEYFNKPCCIITNSKNLLKGSARSVSNFDIGIAIKNALDSELLTNGGGHKMAAGFTLKKDKLIMFTDYIEMQYLKSNFNNKYNLFFYDSKISSTAFNKSFYNDINKLFPFGTGNIEPYFLFENLKILKSKVIKKKNICSFLKSKSGYSIQSISFNSVNNKIGEYLLNYKKEINVIGQIKENFWNNKNTLQLTIKDLII